MSNSSEEQTSPSTMLEQIEMKTIARRAAEFYIELVKLALPSNVATELAIAYLMRL